MKKTRTLIFYFGMVLLFGSSIYFILNRGGRLPKTAVRAMTESRAEVKPMAESALQHLRSALPVLILQIIVIVLVARIFGALFKKIAQPAVVGEIVAGIVLGPSLLGWLFPSVSSFVFPAGSLGNLQLLSQLGLILFMFLIGMELDLSLIRKQAFGAVVISHASIIIPYTLGMGLSYFLYSDFAPAGIPFLSFALFMGIAMSITAFPVLARIIQERGLSGTTLGAMAITCAAADDVTAWCILAALIAIIHAGNASGALITIALVIAYSLVMLFLVRWLVSRLHLRHAGKKPGATAMALVFGIMLISAYATEIIGIHALFGAFIAGIIMPQQREFRAAVISKIEDISIVLLLPLFFAITGLRTEMALLNNSGLWMTFGWILLVAVAGKFGGSTIAARLTGQRWKDSLSIGALMNTRGLMELIALNIGYDLGILSPPIFSMMVLMAVVTTFMTNPALNLIGRLPDK